MNTLRFYLRANSLFSATSGFLMLIFTEKMGQLLGIGQQLILTVIGINLLLFSVYVWFASAAKQPKQHVKLISLLDFLWVAGSMVLLIVQPEGLTNLAFVLIALIALWVAFLAYKQMQHIK